MTVHREPAGGFWTFDSEREPHFDVPTIEELASVWREANSEPAMAVLDDGLYGTFEKADRQPSAIVSLDICEVLRETGLSLERIYGNDLADGWRHKLTNETSYQSLYSAWQGLEAVNNHDGVQIMLQEFMYREIVQAVPYHEAIQAFLQRWRASNVYVIANTSTLPGCEISTVRFLSAAYPQSLRGILLPRNHDGAGTITKAGILERFKKSASVQTGLDFTTAPTVVIEDVPHHAAEFEKATEDAHVFMPAYKWNEELEGMPSITRVTQGLGTIDAFIAADEYLRSRGIVK